MTHPFHPLQGRQLEVVDRRRFPDGEYIYLEVESGEVERVPAAWTSLGPVDPHVALAAGRALFRVADLLRLVDLVADTGAGVRGTDP